MLLGLGNAGVGGSGLDVGWGRNLSQWGLGRQVRSVDLGPSIDHRYDLGRGQVGEGEVMGRGEGQDVALAGNGLGLKEARLEIWMRLVHRHVRRNEYLGHVRTIAA